MLADGALFSAGAAAALVRAAEVEAALHRSTASANGIDRKTKLRGVLGARWPARSTVGAWRVAHRKQLPRVSHSHIISVHHTSFRPMTMTMQMRCADHPEKEHAAQCVAQTPHSHSRRWLWWLPALEALFDQSVVFDDGEYVCMFPLFRIPSTRARSVFMAICIRATTTMRSRAFMAHS